MKSLYSSIILLFCINVLFSQNMLSFSEVYIDNDLIFEKSSDKLFTGSAAKIRKNGHVVYKDIIEEGIILKRIVFFNKSTMPAIENIYFENSDKIETQFRYNLNEPIVETIHFNQFGEKVLSEIHKNKILTYRCEFFKNKKHGKEFCINKKGEEIIKEYKNGKQLK